jgi:phosphate/sulfate permease
VLTTGGTTTFAICLACERRGGSSVSAAWRVVLGWFLKPILALFVALAVLYLLFGDRIR